MELLNYLLKVSACIVIFFAFYLLVLRRLTFFKINRFYLLITLLISFVIPSLHFTVEKEAQWVAEKAVGTATPMEMPLPQVSDLPSKQVEVTPVAFDWTQLIIPFYALTVGVLLMIAIWQLIQLLRHTVKDPIKINNLKLVAKTAGFTNCSFFNYVFIDKDKLSENELEILLAHESVHARQYHSVDKLVMLLAKAFLWFNPIVYLYDKVLEEAHEFEADEATSLSFGSASYANLLLRLAVVKTDIPLVHNFVKSPIKERIKMLFNQKSKNMKKLVYVLALPIVLGLVYGFTVSYVDVFPTAEAKEFTLVIDAGHGGANTGAVVNGLKEEDLTLAVAKKIKAIAEAKGINVILTRNDDEDIKMSERAGKQGDFFLSLQVNSAPNANANAHGIELIIKPVEINVTTLKSLNMHRNLYEGLKNLNGMKVVNTVKQANLYVLKENKLPSVAIELGYLTNLNDRRYVSDAENQTKLANAILSAVINYKNNLKPDEVIQAQIDDTKEKELEGTVVGFGKKGSQKLFDLKTSNGVYAIAFNNIKNEVNVGDELVVIGVKSVLPPPINEPDRFKNESHIYVPNAIKDSNGKLIYQYVPEKYAFLYEANRARFAISKIANIKKSNNGKIEKIVLNDGEFTINLDVKAQQFASENFKKGDKVLVKFIGEKLMSKNTYSTDKMIALYSQPHQFELINKSLYSRFYEEDGRQKLQKPITKNKLPNGAIVTDRMSLDKDKYPELSFSSSDSTIKSHNGKVLDLYGNAKVKVGKSTINGSHINVNLNEKLITAYHANVVSEDSKFTLKSELIKYDLKNNSYTADAVNGFVNPTNKIHHQRSFFKRYKNSSSKETVEFNFKNGGCAFSINKNDKIIYIVDSKAFTEKEVSAFDPNKSGMKFFKGGQLNKEQFKLQYPQFANKYDGIVVLELLKS